MHALVVSSSLDGSSFSQRLAQLYAEALEAHGIDARLVSLKTIYSRGSIVALRSRKIHRIERCIP